MKYRDASNTKPVPHIDEGLHKTGSDMSQIPTYVTAVPNGTEKVDFNSCSYRLLLNVIFRVSIWQWILAGPISESVQFNFMAILPSPSRSRK